MSRSIGRSGWPTVLCVGGLDDGRRLAHRRPLDRRTVIVEDAADPDIFKIGKGQF